LVGEAAAYNRRIKSTVAVRMHRFDPPDTGNRQMTRNARPKSPAPAPTPTKRRAAAAKAQGAPEAAADTDRPAARPQIVSSSHLVSPRSMELSEFEFGLTVVMNAFSRWIVHCMSASGLPELTPLDVVVLHHVNHRSRGKRLSDICFIMDVEDSHLINYSLKKLLGLGVVESTRNGKEVTYSTSAQGREHVERYREVREACLINALNADDALNAQIGDLALMLRMLSGVYDQAARSAASL
jgi:predicted MarR family transcription regulator